MPSWMQYVYGWATNSELAGEKNKTHAAGIWRIEGF